MLKNLVSPCQLLAIPSELLWPRIIAITTLDAAVHGSPALDLLIILHKVQNMNINNSIMKENKEDDCIDGRKFLDRDRVLV
jgi:tRNA (Thr-GGU) A37 N-methylase